MFSVHFFFKIICFNSKTDSEKLIHQCHISGRRTYGNSTVFGVRPSLTAGSQTSWLQLPGELLKLVEPLFPHHLSEFCEV